MDIKLQPKRRKCTIAFEIETRQLEQIRIIVVDPEKKGAVYADGVFKVNGKGMYYVRMPISPKTALVRIYNIKNGNKQGSDGTFRFKAELIPLKTNLNAFNYHNVDTISFLQFLSEFAENKGILSAGNRSVYLSDDGKFRIDYVDTIRDDKGNVLNTPARISKINNRIEFSKSKISNYSIPAVIAIGLHEFGHGYLNNDKSDEIEADLNALRIYLGSGFSRKEAFNIFCKVFSGAKSELNSKRIDKIEQFIMRFEKEPTINYQYYYVGENGEKK